MVYDAAVITVSDESFWGRRADEAGPAVVEILEQAGYRVTHTTLLQKEQAQMERELMHAADQLKVALVVTVGGTGIGPRDVTPEATAAGEAPARETAAQEAPVPEAPVQETDGAPDPDVQNPEG